MQLVGFFLVLIVAVVVAFNVGYVRRDRGKSNPLDPRTWLGKNWPWRILALFLVLVGGALSPTQASADTLSWSAVTTYTDGSSIAPATVTYTAYWTTDTNLTPSNLVPIGAADSTTSRTFAVDTQGMVRGTVVYFTAKATVNGVDSVLANPLAWNVPGRIPAAPTNLRIN